MQPVRVLLLGYGLAGSVFHAPLIAGVPELQLSGIVTRSKRREAEQDYPGVRVFDTAPEGLASGQFDAVVVATPNDSHVPLARQALEAGLHVVVDKPLAPSAEAAQALVDLATARGKVLTVFQNRRWDSEILTLRKLLPELGDVFRFESRMQRWRSGLKPGWREQDSEEMAGGVLFDLGAHLIDQAIYLFGPPRRVHAELDKRRADTLVVDDAFLALEHDNGVHSHLWMSWAAADPGPRLRVLGSRGAYLKDTLDNQEERLKGGLDKDTPEPPGRFVVGPESRSVASEPGAYPEFYRRFAACVRGEGPPPVDPGDAVRVLQVMEAALSSTTAR
jgi:scyllo-inositol 2-dehydrogenase (NADP+)